MSVGVVAAFAALVAAVVALTLPAAATAGKGSLYRGPGPAPGPELLYEKPAKAPQLKNKGPWKAAPILVSGAESYRRGEFLYQDFLFDDHGAQGQVDPGDERTGADTFSRANGTYTYPADPAYGGNSADLVEFRVKPLRHVTAFRITLNTMIDPERVGVTIALGGAQAKTHEVPFGANATAPANRFLTVHGRTAELTRASGDLPKPIPEPRVKISKRRNQIDVRVPDRSWNPRKRRVVMAIGTGLWDPEAGGYLTPGPSASATEPGGSGQLADPTAFFNVGFRLDSQEPTPDPTDPAGTAAEPAWWRDQAQADALAAGDLGAFTAKVDFAKLARHRRIDRRVPSSGPIDRILSSRFNPGEGNDYSVKCFPSGDPMTCPGPYQGRLQPYSLYIPEKPEPARGYGFTLLLHALGTNYNLFHGTKNQSQFGERGKGFVVATPHARGPDGSYANLALADTFEVWADVARRYDLDPGRTAISGYSMGGIGTFKLAELWPDLFAKAQPVVGFGAEDPALLASLRNVPVLMWNGLADELVNPALFQPTANELDSLGYRYELDVFNPGEHLSIAINDEYGPAAEFLGGSLVDRDPAHLTFARDPSLDHPEFGLVADHAYWVSEVETAGPGIGTVDAFSHAFGEDDPPASATGAGAGALPGGAFLDPYPFTRQFKTWGATPEIAAANRIDLEASGVSALEINPERAGVDCGVDLRVRTDVSLEVKLSGCPGTISVDP